MPPGKNMDDWFTIFRTGMWRLWFKLTAEGKRRYFGEFMDVLHQTKSVPLRFFVCCCVCLTFLFRTNALGETDKDAW